MIGEPFELHQSIILTILQRGCGLTLYHCLGYTTAHYVLGDLAPTLLLTRSHLGEVPPHSVFIKSHWLVIALVDEARVSKEGLPMINVWGFVSSWAQFM